MTADDRLLPASETEATEIVRAFYDEGRTLAIEGGGTKADMGRPVFADATLASAGLSGITVYRPDELVISALAGTPLTTINAALEKNSQRLVFEPIDHRVLLGSQGEPTIGGVAATNNSGPRRIVAGAARDSLLGVRFVTGMGQAVKNGGRVMKNVTGLDLVKLMAGSWGTLGFLTEVTFKVLPAAETEATLALRGLDDATAISALAHAMASPNEVTGAAHLPETVSRAMLGTTSSTLVRIEGFADSIEVRAKNLHSLFSQVAEIDVIEAEQSRKIWRDIADVRVFGGDRRPVWRVSIAPSKSHEFVMALRMKAAVDAYYDWQGGLVWLRMEQGISDDAVHAELARHGGGHAMLARADKEVRLVAPVFQPLSPAVAALTERVRLACDPKSVFNPGKMYQSF